MRAEVRRQRERQELYALLDMSAWQRAVAFEKEAIQHRQAYRNMVPMEVRRR